MKLFFELESVNLSALSLILVTLVCNYAFIAVLSSESIGNSVDPELINIGSRSVFNLMGVILLFGACMIIVFVEYIPWKIQSIFGHYLNGAKTK